MVLAQVRRARAPDVAAAVADEMHDQAAFVDALPDRVLVRDVVGFVALA